MKINRNRLAGIFAMLALLGTAACGDRSPSEDSQEPSASASAFAPGTTMAALSNANRLRVGTKYDQPLFGLRGLDGNLSGFDVELAKIIAQALGIPESNIDWIETPTPVREEVLEQGTVDFVIATYTINEPRKERVSFAGPYYFAGQDLMVRADETDVQGPEDLRGTLRVCTVQGSTPSVTIRSYIEENQLVLFDVYSRCADALRTNQVDVVTTDNVILMGMVDANPGVFRLVGNPFTDEPYGIGIRRGDVEFCEFIHETLIQAEQDGRYQQAWESTAGTVAGPAPALPEFDSCS